ncbi:MAG: ribosome maturation factor RimM [Pseudomonadota bacterium]
MTSIDEVKKTPEINRGFFLCKDQAMDKKDLLELGFCVKPHGIKGGFTFHLYNTQDSALTANVQVMLIPRDKKSSLPSEGKVFTIKDIAFGNKVIVYLQGIDDRTVVEKMLPFNIYFPKKELPTLDAGEYYIQDLLQCSLYSSEGVHLGKVENFYDNGAQIVLALDLNGRKIELPFIPVYFLQVDITQKKIVVCLPEESEA